jgi:polysaccharide export outer membrane protein
MKKAFLLYLIPALFVLFHSCTPAKKAMYFPDIEEDVRPVDSLAKEATKQVYPGDRIVVRIVVNEPSDFTMLNSAMMNSGPAVGMGLNSGGESMEGYLVDPDGYIEIPTLGKIKVKGYTPMEIREIVKNLASELYKDPVVYCTLTGRVMILERGGAMIGRGGGMNIGSIALVNERLTILEALAGTSPGTSKLDKVWVIREVDGKRQTKLLNLNSATIFDSPFYYLRNNDMIYIEPTKVSRFMEANAPAWNVIGLVAGMAGLIFGVIAFLQN